MNTHNPKDDPNMNAWSGGNAGFVSIRADAALTAEGADDGFYRLLGFGGADDPLAPKPLHMAELIDTDSVLLLKKTLASPGGVPVSIDLCVTGGEVLGGAEGEPCWLRLWGGLSGEGSERKLTAVAADVTDSRREEEELRIAAEHSGVFIARYRPGSGELELNEETAEMLGASDCVLRGFPNRLFETGEIAPESRDKCLELIAHIDAGEREGCESLRCYNRRNGRFMWYMVRFTALCDSSGHTVCAVLTMRDHTEQRSRDIAYEQYQEYLARLNNQRTAAFEHNLVTDECEMISGGLFGDMLTTGVSDFKSRVLLWSRRIVVEEFSRACVDFLDKGRLIAAYYAGDHVQRIEYRAKTVAGERWVKLTVNLMRSHESEDIKAFMLHEDITEIKLDELALRERSERDPLTGVLNRTAFVAHLEEIIRIQRDCTCAIIMVDVDRFKDVNDTLGHAAGDRALVELTARLRKAMRSDDLIGRVGGDEFIICLTNIPDGRAAKRRADLFCRTMHTQLGAGVELSGSAGVALYPDDGDDFETLYKCADIALYSVKESGRGRSMLYSELRRGDRENLGVHANTPIEPMTASPEMLAAARQTPEGESAPVEDPALANLRERLRRAEENLRRYDVLQRRFEAVAFEYSTVSHALNVAADVSRLTVSRYLYPDRDATRQGMTDGLLLGVHPDDRDLFYRRAMGIVSCGGSFADLSVRLQLIDGGSEWYHIYMVSQADGEGNVVGIIGFARRERGEGGQSDIQLRTLNEQMSDGLMILEIGSELRPLSISESYRRLPGCLADVLEHPGILEDRRVLPDCGSVNIMLRNAALTGDTVDTVFSVRRGGDLYWRRMHAVRVPYAKSEFPVLMLLLTDVTEQKRIERQLAAECERSRFVTDMCGAYVINIQLIDREGSACSVAELSQAAADALRVPVSIDQFPESIIGLGGVHKDSVDAIRSLMAQVRAHAGERVCAGIPTPQYSRIVRVCVVTSDSSARYVPVRVTIRLLAGEQGIYDQACCIGEKVESISRTHLLFEQESHFRRIAHGNIYSYACVNLSTGSVLEFVTDDYSLSERSSIRRVDDLVAAVAGRLQSEEDRTRFAEQVETITGAALNREVVPWSVRDYRYAAAEGQIIWLAIELRTLINPSDGDFYCFVYTRNIDMFKKLSLSLPHTAEYCSHCHSLTVGTMRAVCEEAVRSGAWGCRIGMAVVRIDNYRALQRVTSESDRESLALTVTRKLRCCFPNCCTVAHASEDTFIVLGIGDDEFETMLATTDRAVTVLRDPTMFLSFIESLAVYSFGTDFCDLENASFDLMYDNCIENMNELCITVSELPQSAARPAADSRPITADGTAEGESIGDGAQPSGYEKDLFRMCTEFMTAAPTLDEALSGVLAMVGRYYDAERAFVVELLDEKGTFHNIAQWSKDNTTPGIAAAKSVPIARFPGLEVAKDQCRPYIIADAESLRANGFDEEYELLSAQGIRSSYSVPLISSGITTGFLGIDNPSGSSVDVSPLTAISYFVVSEIERRRAVEHQKYLINHDELTGLLNRKGYLSLVKAVSPESMTSLGLAVVDVNKLDSINSQLGIEFGDMLIIRGASILLEEFSREEVFRYNGGTFYIICRDVTKDSFEKRIKTVGERLDKEYVGNFSIGHLWADAVVSFEHHLEQAKELLRAAKQELSSKESIIRENRSRRRAELFEALDNGWYKVYLQPKFNSETGVLCGAEALARMQHPELGLIGPSKFVPVLESHGNIRFLDLFVLTEVCKLMKGWREKGKPLFPISLNFSRSTLIEPGIVTTMSAIADSYGIAHALIEIELTETLGDLERETVVRIGGSILEAGFRLSLDDFGAKYSNLMVLSSIRFSALKLDKSLVDSILSSKMTRSLLDRVISLCSEYDIECIAEGVESEEQQESLRELGCSRVQGYLYNKPIPTAEFERKYLS